MLRIRTLRKERDISQRELAEHIGASQKSIDGWEKGKVEPTAKFICALSDFFGCSADYLLGREDDFGNVNVESDLTESEKKLLSDYRRLNDGEREQASKFMAFLINCP
ncbi:MAG: helix-turn-helix domain-containing protein [Roseburia sp.]|nr:helix-turn-helix domain-containing protein [Roseburia sp.]